MRYGLVAILLAAATIPSAIKYTADGGTSRLISAKLFDTVSVKDYGAVGDGATNDATAIQNAVNQARTILFPSASYRIASKITVPSGTRLVADGAVTITQATAGELVFYGSGVSNVEIRGFTLSGSLNATQPLSGASNNCGAICFETSGNNFVIEKNVISGFFNGITGTNLTGFWVRGNEVSHWRLYGVLASQTSQFFIEENHLHDNDTPVGAAWSGATTYALGDMATSGGFLYLSLQGSNLNHTPPAPPGDAFWLQFATYGVMATGNRGTVSQLRNSISFNKIYNNPAWDGLMSHDCDGLSVVGNDIRNVRIGMDLSGSGAGKYDEKLVIASNYIEDTSTDIWSGVSARNCAILLFGTDSTVKTRNVAIVGNVTNGFNRFNSGTSASGALCLSNSESTSVTGNQFGNVQNFAGNAAGGIIANGLANGLAIVGNSEDGAAGLPSVRLTNVTADQITISGNTLRDGDGTGGALLVGGSTITQLVASGNATNAATPYTVGTSTLTNERIDFLASGGSNKMIRSYITAQGGTGCISETSTALSAGLTNIDLVTADLSATNSASVQVVVEVSAQQAGNAADTTLYRFRSAATAGRNVALAAVWVPAAATNMVRVDADFASAGVAIAIPKLIWNASTNVATLQFQPQTGTTSYHVTVTATSWRGVATCL